MKVFVSYSSEYQDLAEKISTTLRQIVVGGLPVTVFFDRSNLRAGQGFAGKIEDQVKSSDLMIVLMSEETFDTGSYVINEIEYAKKKWSDPSGHLLPVLVSNKKIENIDPYVSSVTWIETRGDKVARTVSEARHMLEALDSREGKREYEEAKEKGALHQLNINLRRLGRSIRGLFFGTWIAVRERPFLTFVSFCAAFLIFYSAPKYFIQWTASALMDDRYFSGPADTTTAQETNLKVASIFGYCGPSSEGRFCRWINPRSINPIKEKITEYVDDAKLEMETKFAEQDNTILRRFDDLFAASKVQIDTVFTQSFVYTTPFKSQDQGNAENPSFDIAFLAHPDQNIRIRIRATADFVRPDFSAPLSSCPEVLIKENNGQDVCYIYKREAINYLREEYLQNIYLKNSAQKNRIHRSGQGNRHNGFRQYRSHQAGRLSGG